MAAKRHSYGLAQSPHVLIGIEFTSFAPTICAACCMLDALTALRQMNKPSLAVVSTVALSPERRIHLKEG
jgi:hypothetical protein